MLIALLLACAPAHRALPRVDPDVVPNLPAPRAAVYARAPGTPHDPLVAVLAEGLGWDEVLSGAAAGVALAELGGESVDPAHVRWKAILAGYPYPVVTRVVTRSPKGEAPEALIARAREAGEDVDVGLVRARGRDEDVWVLLLGDRRADLLPVAREVDVGDAVVFGAGVAWRAADPWGGVRAGEGTLVPDVAGEWLVRLEVRGRPVAVVPLYVGVRTPEAPPVERAGAGVSVEEQVRALVNDLRDRQEQGALAADEALASVARARLRAVRDGGVAPDVVTQLRAAGFVDVPVAGAECQAATVADCLDQLWWSVDRRAALFGDHAGIGVAAEQGGEGVRVALVVAG